VNYFLPNLARVRSGKLLLVVASTVILCPEYRGTFYCFETLGVCAQLYCKVPGSSFVAFSGSRGYGGGILTRLHREGRAHQGYEISQYISGPVAEFRTGSFQNPGAQCGIIPFRVSRCVVTDLSGEHTVVSRPTRLHRVLPFYPEYRDSRFLRNGDIHL
jgi:hypothetical protein